MAEDLNGAEPQQYEGASATMDSVNSFFSLLKAAMAILLVLFAQLGAFGGDSYHFREIVQQEEMTNLVNLVYLKDKENADEGERSSQEYRGTLIAALTELRKEKRPQKIQAGQGDWQGHDIKDLEDRGERLMGHEVKGRIEQEMDKTLGGRHIKALYYAASIQVLINFVQDLGNGIADYRPGPGEYKQPAAIGGMRLGCA